MAPLTSQGPVAFAQTVHMYDTPLLSHTGKKCFQFLPACAIIGMPTFLIRRVTRSRRAWTWWTSRAWKQSNDNNDDSVGQPLSSRPAFISLSDETQAEQCGEKENMKTMRKPATLRVYRPGDVSGKEKNKIISSAHVPRRVVFNFSSFFFFVLLRFLSKPHILNFVLAPFRSGVLYHWKMMKLTTVFKRVILTMHFPELAYAPHVPCSWQRQIALCHFTINFSLEN